MREVTNFEKKTGLKDEGSDRVNKLILEVRDILRADVLDRDQFEERWQQLVRTVLEDFPDLSVYNLAQLDFLLESQELDDENLFLRRLLVEILPDAENQSFLGHSYRDRGEFELAAKWYQAAFDLIEAGIEERGDLHSAEWLDAVDQLYFLADCQTNLNRNQEAVVTLVKVLGILKNHRRVEWKRVKIYELLGDIFVQDVRPKLAAYYYDRSLQQASQARPEELLIDPQRIKKKLEEVKSKN